MFDQETPLNAPPEVTRIDDAVALSGPDGLRASLTREAAVTLAKRLLRAADEDGGATYQKPWG